ncbi:hypothetical protein ElyMa_005382500, partial [Elysia marginata]
VAGERSAAATPLHALAVFYLECVQMSWLDFHSIIKMLQNKTHQTWPVFQLPEVFSIHTSHQR